MPNLIKIRISVVWRYMKIIWIREHKKCHDNITIYENSLQKFTLLVCRSPPLLTTAATGRRRAVGESKLELEADGGRVNGVGGKDGRPAACTQDNGAVLQRQRD